MKSPLNRVSITMLVGSSCVFSLLSPLYAQTPSMPNNQNQLTSWSCTQGDKKIDIEAQDESFWKQLMTDSEWECSQQTSNFRSGDLQFTCEPEEGTIGILTFTWLSGSGGKEQMAAWMKELDDRPDLSCRMSQVQPWDTQ